MSARLAAIESGLDADRRAGTRPVASTSSSLALPEHPPLTLLNGVPEHNRGTGSAAPSRGEPLDMPVESNPLQMLVSTMEQMSREEAIDADGTAAMVTESSATEVDPTGLGEANAAYEEHLARLAKIEPRSERPDAFARGLVTLEDVQTAFALYVHKDARLRAYSYTHRGFASAAIHKGYSRGYPSLNGGDLWSSGTGVHSCFTSFYSSPTVRLSLWFLRVLAGH